MRRGDRPVAFVLTVVCGLLLQAALLAYLVQHGFVSLSADEFSRSIRSQRWAAAPEFVWWSGVWMPAELYVHGMSHWLFDDPLTGPRVTVFLSSCVLLLSFALLVRRMWGDGIVTLIAVVMLATHPWYVALSGTPMLDVYYLACFIAGVYQLCCWLETSRDRHLVRAGVAFVLASAFHISSWLFIASVNLCLLPVVIAAIRVGDRRRILRLIAYGALSGAFVAYYLTATWVMEGSLGAGIAEHTEYTRWFRDGYDVSVAEKLLYYPTLVVRRDWLLLLVAVPAACVSLLAGTTRCIWLPAIVAAVALTAASVFNVFSVPPSAAPGRYALPYLILLCPYFAMGLRRLVAASMPGWRRSIAALVAAGIVLGVVATHVRRLQSAQVGLHPDSIATGRFLREAARGAPPEVGRILLERHYWEYLAVVAASGLPDGFLFDRPGTKRERHAPSMLADPQGLVAFLDEHGTAFLVVRSEMPPPRRVRLERLTTERDGRVRRIGQWTVYELGPRR